MSGRYEMVIGLEVHVELSTKTKIFCGCSTAFGAPPNTQCCPVCTGMPGSLPVLNGKAVSYAVMAGLATHCTIASVSKMDRKHYFYPDLPKGYQISQYDQPLCSDGYLMITTAKGEKRIGITRIHLEEDAGKLIHHPEKGTLIDCNRCGVPLIEIVSEPDIRSAEEAVAYLRMLRSAVVYTGISDGRMNEGSLRCDVNLSVRKEGDTALGTRTEMKNLNSFQSVEKAIAYEYARQVDSLEKGGTIHQETRRYDQASGKTFSMRRKEDAHDYRYFPDPDLPPILLDPAEIEKIRAEIPLLPWERKARYVKDYGVSAYAASLLVAERTIADYFEEAAGQTDSPITLCNLILQDVFRKLPPEETEIPIPPRHLAALANLLSQGKINSSAGKEVLDGLWGTDRDPIALVEEKNLYQIDDHQALATIIENVLGENPDMVSAYRNGKTNIIKALMGKAMGATKGRGNPVLLQTMLEKALISFCND